MAGPVIDLDRERIEVPRGEPGLPPRWWRWLGLALAATLSGTALVAAAPPSGSRLVEVARVDPASVVTMHVAGSMLYAVMVGGGPHLVGYRLADGARRWSVPLDFSGTAVQAGPIDVIDGSVLVSMHRYLDPVRTVAVDAATGRELWRSDLPQVFGLGLGRTVVLGAYLDADGRPGAAPYPGTYGGEQPLLLHAVEARTGRLVWAYRVPTGWQTVLPAAARAEPASGLVVIAPNGQATTVDLATGAERASAVIDAATISQSGQSDTPARLAVGVYGDQLVLVTSRQGRPTLAAYRLSTLGLQWTAVLHTLAVFVSRCGTQLCVADEDAIYAFAPDTGTPTWTMRNAHRIRAWLGGWIYDEPDPTQSDGATLIDPVTQRVVLNLGRWRIHTPSNSGPVLMTLVEPDATRTWLGLLAAGPRVDVLGVVTELAQNSCQVGDGYMACLTTTDQLRMWRYRR